MKVLLIGSGAVGIGIASALYDSKVELDLIARGGTKQAIEANGIKRIGLLGEVTVAAKDIRIYDGLGEIKDCQYDFVMICAKTTQSPEIIQALSTHKHLLSENGKIILVQNGLEDEAMYLQYFDKLQIYSSRVFIGFIRPELHISEITVYSSGLLMGSLYGYSVEGLEPLALAIEKGGIPCKVAVDIQKNIWAKMLYNCALNPLGAILGVNYGTLIQSDHSIAIMNRVIEEVYEVMGAMGIQTFWPDAQTYQKHFIDKLVPATAEHRSSTLQDIEKKAVTEIDALTGAIVDLGKKYEVPVPYNEMIFHLIKTIESGY